MWQRDELRETVFDQASIEANCEMFIEKYHISLSAYVYHLIGSYEATQDIVQDTWITFYRYLPQLLLPWPVHPNIPAWLWTVARNKTNNYRKVQQRTISLDTEETTFIFEPHVPPFDYPENAAMREDVSLFLYEAVNALGKQERDVIALRFFYDYSLKDIAQVLHIPLNTVRSHLRRGLCHLQRLLLTQGVGRSDIDLWDKTDEDFPKVILRE